MSKPGPNTDVVYDWVYVARYMEKKYPKLDWENEIFSYPANGMLCHPPEDGERAELLAKEFPDADMYHVWW